MLETNRDINDQSGHIMGVRQNGRQACSTVYDESVPGSNETRLITAISSNRADPLSKRQLMEE